MTPLRRALVWALGLVSALLLVQQAEAQSLFTPITPCRLVDTRVGSPLQDGVPQDFAIAGVCGIPSGPTAVALNFTVVSPTGEGSLTVYPAGGSSLLSLLQFPAGSGRVVSSSIDLAISAGGEITALASVAGSGTVHLIVNTYGYFTEGQ